jgi:hypothetical protein
MLTEMILGLLYAELLGLYLICREIGIATWGNGMSGIAGSSSGKNALCTRQTPVALWVDRAPQEIMMYIKAKARF